MRRLIVPFLALLITSCAARIHDVYLSDQTYPPHHQNYPIRIYRDTLPDEPFDEIAVLSFRLSNKLQSLDKALEAMKTKARELGGEAIINFGQRTETGAIVPVGGVLMIDSDPVYTGTVIRFRDHKKLR